MTQRNNEGARGPGLAQLSDEEVVSRVRSGETELYAIIAKRHARNLQIFLRRMLQNSEEAEDVIQEAHLQALTHLSQFAGRSSFSTWLTRIVFHEALRRVYLGRRLQQLESVSPGQENSILVSRVRTPEQQTADSELRVMLQHALAGLPEPYRIVFLMREVDMITTADAAQRLGVSAECVKTRLCRARSMLRKRCDQLEPQARTRCPEERSPRPVRPGG